MYLLYRAEAIIGGLLFGWLRHGCGCQAGAGPGRLFRSAAADFTYNAVDASSASPHRARWYVSSVKSCRACWVSRSGANVRLSWRLCCSFVPVRRHEKRQHPAHGESVAAALPPFNIYRILVSAWIASAVSDVLLPKSRLAARLVSCNQFAIIFGMLVVYTS